MRAFHPFSLGVFVLALAGVLTFALSDELRLPAALDGHDKALHVIAFFVLAGALVSGASRMAMAGALVALTALAIGLEWIQPLLTATREGSLADAAASAVGIGAGATAALGARSAALVLRTARAPAPQR